MNLNLGSPVALEAVTPSAAVKDYDQPIMDIGPDAPMPLPPSPANIAKAKAVALEGWRERARERGLDKLPSDLSGACKFASMFAQRLFGGELRGNHDHQFLLLDGAIIDLTDGSEELDRLRADGKDPYLHDRRFWGNREHKESMRSCERRVNAWTQKFLDASVLQIDTPESSRKV
jgi:hypothetical protein